MATPVTQYYSPDPSLSTNPNFGSFTQYLITGTNYITDSKAQAVYEFNPAVPGVLTQTAGSYAQFQAYLNANPITSTIPNPTGAAGSASTFGFPYIFQSIPGLPGPTVQSVSEVGIQQLLEKIFYEIKASRLALVSLAINGNVADPADFDPTTSPDFAGENTGLYS